MCCGLEDLEEKLCHVREYTMHVSDVQADRALEHTLHSENLMEGAATGADSDGRHGSSQMELTSSWAAPYVK